MEQRLIEILKIALEYQVSDIHFDITNGKKEKMNIEMRIDGQMKQLIPKEDDIRLFYYLMYRANLDVSNTFQPQTGSFHERVLQQDLSLRFSIVSSYYMRSGVDVQVIGTGSVLRTAVIFFYISNEGVSLLENAAHLGLPVPEKIKIVL